MRQHLLTAQSRTGHGGCPGSTGFEPAMRGEREYGFAAPGVSAADSDSRFLAGTLTARGYHPTSSARPCAAGYSPGASCTGIAT